MRLLLLSHEHLFHVGLQSRRWHTAAMRRLVGALASVVSLVGLLDWCLRVLETGVSGSSQQPIAYILVVRI
jgi:hypothetical protein